MVPAPFHGTPGHRKKVCEFGKRRCSGRLLPTELRFGGRQHCRNSTTSPGLKPFFKHGCKVADPDGTARRAARLPRTEQGGHRTRKSCPRDAVRRSSDAQQTMAPERSCVIQSPPPPSPRAPRPVAALNIRTNRYAPPRPTASLSEPSSLRPAPLLCPVGPTTLPSLRPQHQSD